MATNPQRTENALRRAARLAAAAAARAENPRTRLTLERDAQIIRALCDCEGEFLACWTTDPNA